MGKIDEVKEILNTLRIAMSIAFGMLVIVVGSAVKRYDNHQVDALFWSAIVFSLALLGIIFILVMQIAKKTKEIKDL